MFFCFTALHTLGAARNCETQNRPVQVNNSQVQPAFLRPDVGDVANVRLVRLINIEAPAQNVLIRWLLVIAASRDLVIFPALKGN